MNAVKEMKKQEKFYVRGRCIKFSPITINKYLERNEEDETEEVDLLGEVTKEITGGQETEWPKKGLLPTGKLSVKYAILSKIGSANWTPTNHASGITPMLAKLIYLIGLKKKINYGEHVFNQTMKHAETFATKLAIAFPALITRMILNQHPDILHPGEVPSKKPLSLSFDYKLFGGSHVPDIVIPKGRDIVGTSCSLPKANKEVVLAELMEVSKTLGETISISTTRKAHVDKVIKSMTQEVETEFRDEDAGNEETAPEED
jgi:hypothetical protein